MRIDDAKYIIIPHLGVNGFTLGLPPESIYLEQYNFIDTPSWVINCLDTTDGIRLCFDKDDNLLHEIILFNNYAYLYDNDKNLFEFNDPFDLESYLLELSGLEDNYIKLDYIKNKATILVDTYHCMNFFISGNGKIKCICVYEPYK